MGFLSGLMGGTTNTSTTTSGMPAWFEAYSQNLTNAGTNRFLNAAYPGALPPEQRVAPDNADINASRAGVRSMQGASNPLIDQAAGVAGSIGTSLDPTAFNSFMNPYTSAVVDRLGVLGQRNLENSARTLNANFISGGNFGSGENSEYMARLVRDNNESTQAAQSQALQQGFGTALNAYGQAQNTGLQASSQMGALAKLKQDTSLRDAAALEEVGKDQRQRAQMGMDVNNANFLEGRDWERNMAMGAANLGSGINVPTTQTTTNTSTQNAGLGQLLGLGTSLAGLFMRQGGRVPRGGALRRAQGGKIPNYVLTPTWDPATGLRTTDDGQYVDRDTGRSVDERGRQWERPERPDFTQPRSRKRSGFARGGAILRPEINWSPRKGAYGGALRRAA